MSKGKVILLLVGVSGSGKTTLGIELQKMGIPELISCTTRQKRKGEIDGVTYYYVTEKEFDEISGKLERTEYAGHKYCLTKEEVERHKEDLVYCIVDSNGIQQIKYNYGKENVVTIYVHVGYHQMKERLEARGDSEDEIKKRIDYAIKNNEMERDFDLADYYITNDNLETSKKVLEYIVGVIRNEKDTIS